MELVPGYISGFFAVLLLSAFAKFATVLSIFTYGLGLRGAAFGAVVAGLALALSLLVMAPQVEELGGLDAVLSGKIDTADDRLELVFRPFLEKHAAPEVLDRLQAVAKRLTVKNAEPEQPSEVQAETQPTFSTLIAAFLVSELQDAFKLGFMILIPFLVIDLLVVNIMLALGVTQMPVAVVALPLKILVFLAVNGWLLISEKLINSYL